jgi:hypothetical protein
MIIFGSKAHEITGQGKLHEELENVRSSPNTVKENKMDGIRSMHGDYDKCISTCRKNLMGKAHSGDVDVDNTDNIKMELKDVGLRSNIGFK